MLFNGVYVQTDNLKPIEGWKKVQVDTPLYCQANLYQNACKAHFAIFKNGIVYV